MNCEQPRIATSERIEAIDEIRGFAILLVVIGHTIQVATSGFGETLLFRLIYSFHMPLFFFISGVVSSAAVRRPLKELLRAKSIGLLVPFASWWVVMNVATALNRDYSFWDALVTLYQSPDVALWFLWVLFVVTLLTALTLRFSPRAAVGLAAVSAMLWLARIPVLGMVLVAYYFPPFVAGVWLSPGLIGGWTSKRRAPAVAAVALAVGWLALAVGWRRLDLAWPVQQWAAAGYPMPVGVDLGYRYLAAAAGVAASLAIVPAIPWPRWGKASLAYLGRNTLEIYVSHGLILTLFPSRGVAHAVVAGVLALGGSLALAVVLKRIRLLRTALYGGRD